MYSLTIKELCAAKNMLDEAVTEENYKKLFIAMSHSLLVQLCNYNILSCARSDYEVLSMFKDIRAEAAISCRREMAFILENLPQITLERQAAFYNEMLVDIRRFEKISRRLKNCPLLNWVEYYRLKGLQNKMLQKRYSYYTLLACIAQKYYHFNRDTDSFIAGMMHSVALA